MYRELIGQLTPGHRCAAPREGATPAEIQKAEQMLDCLFPQELRALLLEMNGDGWFLWSVEQIMDMAEQTRRFLYECYESTERFLFMAENGCGDYYGYRIEDGGNVCGDEILIWLHEINRSETVATSVEELIRRYYLDEI